MGQTLPAPCEAHQGLRPQRGQGQREKVDRGPRDLLHPRLLRWRRQQGLQHQDPREVAEKGYGYLEDRRPSSNCDPYSVTKVIVQTICLDEWIQKDSQNLRSLRDLNQEELCT